LFHVVDGPELSPPFDLLRHERPTDAAHQDARDDGLSIDQIAVSPGTYLSSAPGAAKDDATLLPR
jgi:hypothetical protein